jgi:phytoene synthase
MERGRVYFPGVDFKNFTIEDKKDIEKDIESEFRGSLDGIRSLDRGSRRGVYLAYSYYKALFSKIRKTPPEAVTRRRFRISDTRKLILLIKAIFYDVTGMI